MDKGLDFEASDELGNLLIQINSQASEANIRKFFEKLFSVKLFVPKRSQVYPLSNSPAYPNDLVHVMGIQATERVVVPAFSKAEYIENWSGNPFEYYELQISDLAGKIPEDWWLVLNPGFAVEKEFSPWEVIKLKEGGSSLDELIAESLSDLLSSEPLEIKTEDFEDRPEFKESLLDFLKSQESITSCSALKEVFIDEEANTDSYQINFALYLHKELSSDDKAKLKDDFSNFLAPHFIGGDKFKIYIFDSNKSSASGSPMEGLFKNARAVYTSGGSKGLLARVFRLFS